MTFRDTSAFTTLDNANMGMREDFEKAVDAKFFYSEHFIKENLSFFEMFELGHNFRQPEIDTLKAEVKHWKANYENMVNRSRVLIDRPDLPLERVQAFHHIKRLQAENDRLRADAERYAWLRNRDLDAISLGGVFAGLTPHNVVVNGDDLDRLIDAAMKNFSTQQKEE